LPNRQENRFKVIQQKSHRSGYESQIELCGAKNRHWSKTRKELEASIKNEKTA